MPTTEPFDGLSQPIPKSAFRTTFGGSGLAGRATHYCAGCGHGLIHKMLAQSLHDLGIQERTVAVSPVGCAVFLYRYLDVGNTQAAHGRAPAVALGHKLANPQSVVVSYQGDGDLASIGLAEILQVCQMGLPLTFLFVNNAIYGMTGGQMAPTTLLGQTTTTSPTGRDRFTGAPLAMAEMVARLDGPVYVERVALYDAKQRHRARKAIEKAIRLQVEGRGLSFVEILSECPTHLHATPLEAQRWVEEKMVPAFPLGVLKDLDAAPLPTLAKPSYDPQELVRVVGNDLGIPGLAAPFPSHIDSEDIAIKFAGSGGDGVQTAAKLTVLGAISQGFDATLLPSYGPASRGGTSYADVHLARHEVLDPACPNPKILVAFNAPSITKFAPAVRSGGFVLYDSTVVATLPTLAPGVTILGVPFTQIADELGWPQGKNVVALGALTAATRILHDEACRSALERTMASLPQDRIRRAFELGAAAVVPADVSEEVA